MSLWSYIQGKRKGKEAHRLEKEAMHDPFLADALEGYDSIPGDHLSRLQQMQQRVTTRSSRKTTHSLRRYWSIAAGLALLLGLGGGLFYYSQYTNQSTPIAQQELSIEPVEIIADASSAGEELSPPLTPTPTEQPLVVEQTVTEIEQPLAQTPQLVASQKKTEPSEKDVLLAEQLETTLEEETPLPLVAEITEEHPLTTQPTITSGVLKAPANTMSNNTVISIGSRDDQAYSDKSLASRFREFHYPDAYIGNTQTYGAGADQDGNNITRWTDDQLLGHRQLNNNRGLLSSPLYVKPSTSNKNDSTKIQVSGIVYEKGKDTPSSGVQVVELNDTLNRTHTNPEGRFTIRVDSLAILQFTTLARDTLRVPVEGRTDLGDIYLVPAHSQPRSINP